VVVYLCQIHDHSLSWLGTVTLIKSRHRYNMDNPNTQIHDHSLSWLGTVTSIKGRHRYNMDNPKPSQESEWSCICVLGLSMLYLCLLFIKVTVPSQESEWSCICVLGLSMLYLCLLFIKVTAPSQESEWSCICDTNTRPLTFLA
jgi:hypothetical protein